MLEEGDTDTAPYGLGTYASRSTPVAGAATAMASRKIREKAKKIAAHLLEVSEEDLEWEPGKFYVKGAPSKAKTIQEIAFAAYTNLPPGMEAGLEAVHYYDPPNLTFPFGTYICVVDIDKGTGEVKVRRFIAVDDCGNIINPMIVEGQIHGGLTEGLAIAFMQLISYDESGNVQGGNFMDYLVPTAVETPHWETGKTCTPSPHHPIGAKGVGESPNVGSPAAFVNAVVDALSHLGVTAHRHADHAVEGVADSAGKGHRVDMAVRIEKTFQVSEPIDQCLGLAERSAESGQLRSRRATHRDRGRAHIQRRHQRQGGAERDRLQRPGENRAAGRSGAQIEMDGKGQDVRGKGGASMKMTGTLQALDGGGTRVFAVSEVNVVGILAQLGGRMIHRRVRRDLQAVHGALPAEAPEARRPSPKARPSR